MTQNCLSHRVALPIAIVAAVSRGDRTASTKPWIERVGMVAES
jgi:hypothetical protein